jgi:hypothetical protein
VFNLLTLRMIVRGSQVSNLSRDAFQNSSRVQASQRVHNARAQRRQSGYVGNRTLGQNQRQLYPYQVGAMAAGNIVSSTAVPTAQWPAQAIAERAMGLNVANGLGQGGTAASAAGAAGGNPA